MNDFDIHIETKALICVFLCISLYTDTNNGLGVLKEVITETSAAFSSSAPSQPSQVVGYDLIVAPSGEGGGYDLG